MASEGWISELRVARHRAPNIYMGEHSLAVSQTRLNSRVTGHGRERAHYDSINEFVCDTYLAHIVHEMLRIAVGHVNADLVDGCLADLREERYHHSSVDEFVTCGV